MRFPASLAVAALLLSCGNAEKKEVVFAQHVRDTVETRPIAKAMISQQLRYWQVTAADGTRCTIIYSIDSAPQLIGKKITCAWEAPER